jgi:hypothetical protein
VFPIYDTCISDILGESIVASTVEFRFLDGNPINYFYPAFTIINMTKLKNANELDFGLAPGLDVGGKSKEFIKNNINSIKFIPNHQSFYFIKALEEDSQPIVKYFIDDLVICRSHGLSAGWVAEGFYHYVAGSRWNENDKSTFSEGHSKRMQLFLNYFY